MMPPIVPRRVYYEVYAILLVLTLLTVGVSMIDLGPFNLLVAIGIAVAKALLVMLIFMHLRYSTRLTWIVAGAGVIWLGHMLLFTMSDYLSRGWSVGLGW
jgi:cytochrome c oxidase subunit IV